MSLFFTKRFYLVGFVLICLLFVANIFEPLYWISMVLVGLWLLATLVDFCILYFPRKRPIVNRICSERFSNGDENEVSINFNNPYRFTARVEIIDEMPVEFEMRDFVLTGTIKAAEERTATYKLTPTRRGEYKFDRIRLFFSSPVNLVQRRFTCGAPCTVKVYPSYAKLSLYSLMAAHHHLDEYGIKQIRQVGADTEFDQIKDYVQGDEYRHINWKASARAHSLKVNVYQQERSMQIYSLIDKGRMMQQMSGKLNLLEHSVNAALALSYVAVKKEDKVGIASFSKEMDTYVPANRIGNQMQKLMESLYNQQTIFEESDYSSLSNRFLQKCTKRSLVILFANFATQNALLRELPYLRQINSHHKLIVVIFKDREMTDFIERAPHDNEEFCQQMMVEKYVNEKELIIHTLHKNGIHAIHSHPENLSVNVINKYLEVRRF